MIIGTPRPMPTPTPSVVSWETPELDSAAAVDDVVGVAAAAAAIWIEVDGAVGVLLADIDEEVEEDTGTGSECST